MNKLHTGTLLDIAYGYDVLELEEEDLSDGGTEPEPKKEEPAEAKAFNAVVEKYQEQLKTFSEMGYDIGDDGIRQMILLCLDACDGNLEEAVIRFMNDDIPKAPEEKKPASEKEKAPRSDDEKSNSSNTDS